MPWQITRLVIWIATNLQTTPRDVYPVFDIRGRHKYTYVHSKGFFASDNSFLGRAYPDLH